MTGVDGLSYLAAAPGGSAFTGTNPWELKAGVALIAFDADIDETEVCTEVARQAQNTGQFFCSNMDGAKVSDYAAATAFSYVSAASGGAAVEEQPEDPNAPLTMNVPSVFKNDFFGTATVEVGQDVGSNVYAFTDSPSKGVTWRQERPLPNGISFNSSTGRFSGAATVEGFSQFTVEMIKGGEVVGSYTGGFRVVPNAPTEDSPIYRAAVVEGTGFQAVYPIRAGENLSAAKYQFKYAAGYTRFQLYKIDGATLPAGVTFNPSTGQFEGSSNAPGSYGAFQIGAFKDGNGKTFDISIVVR